MRDDEPDGVPIHYEGDPDRCGDRTELDETRLQRGGQLKWDLTSTMSSPGICRNDMVSCTSSPM